MDGVFIGATRSADMRNMMYKVGGDGEGGDIMWMVVILCSATSTQCSLYDDLDNLSTYAYNLYKSKQACSRDGEVAIKKWAKKDGGNYVYYCQNASSPAAPP